MSTEHRIDTALAAFEAWNARGVAARAEVLSRAAAGLPSVVTAMAQWQIDNALASIAEPLMLPGPTGESNRIFTSGRGLVLVTGDDSCDATALSGELFAALIAGNVVLIAGGAAVLRVARPIVAALRQAGCPSAVVQLAEREISTADICKLPELAVVAICCKWERIRALHEGLAARDGPLVQLIVETVPLQLPSIGHPDYLLRFITERTVTDNTAAVGGNALLLSLSGD